MAEEKRKKPTFLRRDWQKKIKFGKTVKKNRKWRAAKGRQNKIRLSVKGYSKRPKIGYGESRTLRHLHGEHKPTYVSNVKDLSLLAKGSGIIITKVGEKKKKEILKVANEKGLVILNKYKVEENGSNK